LLLKTAYLFTMNVTNILAVEPTLHTLIPIEEFKLLLGVDDRDDKLTKFCTDMEFPYLIELSPKLRMTHCTSVNVVYCAGYTHNNIPADLAAACLELSAWNMSRYKRRRGRTILFIFFNML
jgi:hypothetical protein